MRVEQESSRGSVLEVFLVFLRLGCVSFGGPVAHLGYFEKELVAQRRWCDEDSFAEIIALAQSLPGPSSSQVSFGMGIVRAGWLGGVAAWTGFTLPSALLMFGFAFGAASLSGRLGVRLIHGLQIVAVAVVAQAVLTMQRSLAPDRKRVAIAIVALAVVLFAPAQLATLFAIVGGAIAGLTMFRHIELSQRRAAMIQAPQKLGAVLRVTLLRHSYLTTACGSRHQQVGDTGAFSLLSERRPCLRRGARCPTAPRQRGGVTGLG